MSTAEDKVKINARIPKNLYDWIGSTYGNVSQAVNDGLEILRKTKAGECDTKAHNSTQNRSQEPTDQNGELSQELKEALEILRTAEQNYEHLQARIEDLKTQLQAVYGQLSIKDGQIEKLNENMHKQAVHIQSLIQENSRLNIKLLPENTEPKRPWYKFW